MKFKIGDKVAIKKSAVVGQDFRYFKFHEQYPMRSDTIFTIDHFMPDKRVALKSYGFGILQSESGDRGSYGCGKVYCKTKDLVKVKL